ncbi:MAG TPA: EpsG family protein [Gallicola sp.]|nr:EpsG family protein [Gallicola sp.]
MTIYIIIFVLLIGLSYHYDIRHNKSGYDFWRMIVLISLILLAGLRNRIGIDTIRYERAFTEIPNLFSLFREGVSLDEISQPLWFLFNSFSKTIYDSFVTVQLAHAVLFNTLLFNFLKKTTNKQFVSLLFIYCTVWYNFNFEVLRESLCVVIYLNSLSYLQKRQFVKYFVIGSIAVFIHWFSFLIIIITPLVVQANRKRLLAVFILLGSVILLLDTSSINNYLIRASTYMALEVSNRIEAYLSHGNLGFINISLLGGVFIIISNIIYPIFISLKLKDKLYGMLYSRILLLYILIIPIRMKFLIFGRYANYLDIILIVYSINLLFDKKLRSQATKYIIISWFIFETYSGITSFYKPMDVQSIGGVNYDCRYIPYTTVFQESNSDRELLYNSILGYGF